MVTDHFCILEQFQLLILCNMPITQKVSSEAVVQTTASLLIISYKITLRPFR